MMKRLSTRVPRRLPIAAPRQQRLATRAISTTATRLAPSSTNPFSSSSVSTADAFQLLPESQKAGEAEDALYESEIKEVEAWWSSPRFSGIRRTYTAADVVSKRGSQKINYPSSVMATKLFNLLKEREAKRQPVHTSKRCNVEGLNPKNRSSMKELTAGQWARLTPCK